MSAGVLTASLLVLSCDWCSFHVLPHPPPPALHQHLLPWAKTRFWIYIFPHFVCAFSPSFCVFTPFISLCLGSLQCIENELLISPLINLPSTEVPPSLPAWQNDDWHFYLFGEISVGAKLNFNGTHIPPVKGAIHYWMIVMLFVASVDLWCMECGGPKVGTFGKEAVRCWWTF